MSETAKPMSHNGWIACSERLPPVNDRVLFWSVRYSLTAFQGTYTADPEGWWDDEEPTPLLGHNRPTHWRSMPEGPHASPAPAADADRAPTWSDLGAI